MVMSRASAVVELVRGGGFLGVLWGEGDAGGGGVATCVKTSMVKGEGVGLVSEGGYATIGWVASWR